MIAGAFTRGLRELETCSGAGRPGVLGLSAEKLSVLVALPGVSLPSLLF